MPVRRILILFGLLFGSGTLSAESHPAWWRYASPEATAMVGIDWEHLRSSPFANAIEAELSEEGGLGFPDLDCLKEASRILISSPALLAVATGNFSEEIVRDQAARRNWKRIVHHEIEIWVTPGKGTLSIARMSDQLILLGRVKNLQDAIDRSLAEDANRGYSPLLPRAAHYAQDDLWVVAARLPDPLAERFVPIDAEAEGFEGGVSLENGLRFGAVLNASSEEAAIQLADSLKRILAALPPVAQQIQVNPDQTQVILGMTLTRDQFAAALRTTPEASAKLEPIHEPAPAKPIGPQLIRIFGLDDGPREIVLR